MEEVKNKTIKMTAQSTQEQSQGKLEYKQLEDFARQLSQQNKELIQRLQENQMQLMFTILDFLIRIVEVSNKESKYKFNDNFMQRVISLIEERIEQLTTPPEKEDKYDSAN